jgi:hypothetical protein
MEQGGWRQINLGTLLLLYLGNATTTVFSRFRAKSWTGMESYEKKNLKLVFKLLVLLERMKIAQKGEATQP